VTQRGALLPEIELYATMTLWRRGALSAATQLNGDPIIKVEENRNEKIKHPLLSFEDIFIVPSLNRPAMF
jgi:hypothetical protein